MPARHGAISNAVFGGGLFAFNLMKKKNISLVQLVLETLEFADDGTGFRYKIRPRRHFHDIHYWRSWNQENAGRTATKSMLDEDGCSYFFVEIQYPWPWEKVFVWADRVQYILSNREDHPKGERFGAFLGKGGEK